MERGRLRQWARPTYSRAGAAPPSARWCGRAVDAVSGPPGERRPCDGLPRACARGTFVISARDPRPLQHGRAQLRLGGERNRFGRPRVPAPVRVLGPLLGKAKRAVDQGVAVAARVTEEHAGPCALDPPGRARALRRTPADSAPLFRKPVSSSASTASASPRRSVASDCRPPLTASASHSARPGKSRAPSGVASPAAAANCQPFSPALLRTSAEARGGVLPRWPRGHAAFRPGRPLMRWTAPARAPAPAPSARSTTPASPRLPPATLKASA